MKRSTFACVLAAVFLTATVVTAFALTLVMPSGMNGRGFLLRWFDHAWRFGWAAGIPVTIIFFILRRRA